ncbi:A/G-specific adenine glycosylase [uncultured Sphingomonas sp.]|uniref:A/G-specific adenine glycosylase n=1 Tax=uncultured Sphingomonas sp. TaxID=158754 RepID=UPI0025DE3489|nr:A/G-specific adenine glycosylase [uncultured Sphingomonas sp.]
MSAKVSPQFAVRLLAWYDAHARTLPWRSPPGSPPPDPYRVWLSEVMLQQTTVAAVRPRFESWVARWPTLEAFAAALDEDVMAAWAGLGYYARARNLLKCARAVVSNHGGRFPDTEAELRSLPGLGDYTAAAIAAIAFGRRAVVIDANVKRVVARLFADDGTNLRAQADSITPDTRAGDFAQAMMDLGSGICTTRAPKCLLCPLRDDCAGFASGDPEAFPAKKAKAAKPTRYGTIFWLTWGDEVLLVRRAEKGLLGGMRALPTGPWSDDAPDLADAPAQADWQWRDDEIIHVFTHFRLICRLAAARVEAQTAGAGGEWWPVARLAEAGLPTLFAKAADKFRRD